MIRIGSLFSGAGGLDLAVEEVFGGETIWHSEIDKAASRVLAYRWPGVPNLGSITEIDWASVEPVDVLCGGFPCQDVSAAGKRAGIKAGTRSGLWSVFAEAIDQLRPRFVVIENVRGLLSAAAHRTVEDDAGDYLEPDPAGMGDGAGRPVLRAAGAVLGDLADLGYDAVWATVAAADVGAPHRRERVFILATSADAECGSGARIANTGGYSEADREGGQAVLAGGFGADVVSADEPGVALLPTPGTLDAVEKRTTHAGGNLTLQGAVVGVNPVDVERHARAGRTVSGDEPGVALLPTPTTQDGANNGGPSQFQRNTLPLNAEVTLLPTPSLSDNKTPQRGAHLTDTLDNNTHTINLADAIEYQHGRDALLPTPKAHDGEFGTPRTSGRPIDKSTHLGTIASLEHTSHWGKYEPAIRRWENVVGPAPAPTEPNKNGNPRLSAAFSEWLMGWPAGWVTDPAIGISRNDQLRIVGNGVCPQQAAAALQYLLNLEVAA